EADGRGRIIWWRLGYWAAAVAIIVVSLGVFLMADGRAVIDLLGQNKVSDGAPPIALLPGEDKATLTLWDGTVINLENAGPGYLEGEANFKIDPEKGELTYKGLEEQVGYNLLTTPLGGQYKVVLPDGSAAWLNAGSSLKF